MKCPRFPFSRLIFIGLFNSLLMYRMLYILHTTPCHRIIIVGFKLHYCFVFNFKIKLWQVNVYKIKLTNKSFSYDKYSHIMCRHSFIFSGVPCTKLSKQNFPGLAKRAETLLPCYTALILVVFCYYY